MVALLGDHFVVVTNCQSFCTCKSLAFKSLLHEGLRRCTAEDRQNFSSPARNRCFEVRHFAFSPSADNCK